ncbi:MAG: CapA family protein [Deltaproteobacteria bacterium]|nr:CapA family protein [Deltaproteobacteria bacterium]
MSTKLDNSIVFYAAGDIAPYREDLDTIFRHVKPVIEKGDLAFCQLESLISDRGIRLPHRNPVAIVDGKPFMHEDVYLGKAIKNAGFTVVSFAGNHCLDLGDDAFFDTINAVKKEGMYMIGVGANIEEARKPAIVERKGTKIAFLAYNSILPPGYWATPKKPGCAPLRGITVYTPLEPDQPGRPAKVLTYPNREDLQAMIADIEKIRGQADIVIVSQHCGIHFVPAVIADYQKDLAHAAIDSGADLVLQHHSHILKGIEVYKGKVIFYSLGNFALELPYNKEFHKKPPNLEEVSRWEMFPEYLPWAKYDPSCPSFPFHPEARLTLMVKCIMHDKQIQKVAFLPVYLNNQAEPEIQKRNDKRFNEIITYIEDISRREKIATKYSVSGDEVIIIDN